MRIKIITFTILFLCIMSLTGCTETNNANNNSKIVQEQQQMIEGTVDVTVTNINYQHWYASGHHYTCDISVYCDKYNLDKTFHFTNMDAIKYENVKRDDILQAKIIMYKDSNDNITQIFIDNLE